MERKLLFYPWEPSNFKNKHKKQPFVIGQKWEREIQYIQKHTNQKKKKTQHIFKHKLVYKKQKIYIMFQRRVTLFYTKKKNNKKNITIYLTLGQLVFVFRWSRHDILLFWFFCFGWAHERKRMTLLTLTQFFSFLFYEI